jgi:hypothetical protein
VRPLQRLQNCSVPSDVLLPRHRRYEPRGALHRRVTTLSVEGTCQHHKRRVEALSTTRTAAGCSQYFRMFLLSSVV